MSFDSLEDVRAILRELPEPDTAALTRAEARNAQLTKPPGALGRLEELAIWYASWCGSEPPKIEHPQVVIFAGNHGVAARGVSAFPSEVTAQMVANFAAGGAAINQLSDCFGARLDVVPLALEQPTQDFTQVPAMTEAEVCTALQAGWDAVADETDVLIVGEMGIGNTTSAAALACAAFGGSAEDWTGRGTGVSDDGLALKCEVVAAGVARHSGDGLELLRCLGGREIAAMAGAILRARMLRVPVLLDGFIASAAAGMLRVQAPGALLHVQAGHLSAEGAHARLLEQLGLEPLLSLGLRLGEGSGAAVSFGVLQAAVACHSGMATFADAGVSET